MPQSSSAPGTHQPEANIHEVDGVPVYGRKDQDGMPAKIDAIDQDQRKIWAIADYLQRRGFGVMRQRSPRAGKVFYTLSATWVGDGDPPRDPFDGA